MPTPDELFEALRVATLDAGIAYERTLAADKWAEQCDRLYLAADGRRRKALEAIAQATQDTFRSPTASVGDAWRKYGVHPDQLDANGLPKVDPRTVEPS